MFAVGTLAGPAAADPQTAREHLAAAERLAAAGDLAGAAAKFLAAFAEDPRPEYICNVGVAYHKAQDLPRTQRYLGQCVAMGSSLEPSYRENLRKVVEATEAKLVAGNYTPVDFALAPGTATVRIDGGVMAGETLVGAGRLWLPYATYQLTISAAGYIDRVVALEARTHDAVRMQLTLDPAPATIAPPPRVAPVGDPARPVRDPAPPSPAAPSKLPAAVATVGTGVLGIAGALLYLKARIYVNDAEQELDFERFGELRDRSRQFQKLSWVAGGLAGAGAIASSYLWYRALRSPARVEVAATATGGGAALWLFGQF